MAEPLDLEPIKARAEAAWPERWISQGDRIGCYDSGRWFTLARTKSWEGPRVDGPNADFVAAARTDVPALVAELERLRDLAHDLAAALVASHDTGDAYEDGPGAEEAERALSAYEAAYGSVT